MLQRVNELKWLGIYFGAGKHIRIVEYENRRKYNEFLAGIMQKVGLIHRECLVKILLHCIFQKLMYCTGCNFSIKSILNPLNIAFNDGSRKVFQCCQTCKCKADY